MNGIRSPRGIFSVCYCAEGGDKDLGIGVPAVWSSSPAGVSEKGDCPLIMLRASGSRVCGEAVTPTTRLSHPLILQKSSPPLSERETSNIFSRLKITGPGPSIRVDPYHLNQDVHKIVIRTLLRRVTESTSAFDQRPD